MSIEKVTEKIGDKVGDRFKDRLFSIDIKSMIVNIDLLVEISFTFMSVFKACYHIFLRIIRRSNKSVLFQKF